VRLAREPNVRHAAILPPETVRVRGCARRQRIGDRPWPRRLEDENIGHQYRSDPGAANPTTLPPVLGYRVTNSFTILVQDPPSPLDFYTIIMYTYFQQVRRLFRSPNVSRKSMKSPINIMSGRILHAAMQLLIIKREMTNVRFKNRTKADTHKPGCGSGAVSLTSPHTQNPREDCRLKNPAWFNRGKLCSTRPNLEADDMGKFDAIDIESGEFAIDAAELKACHKLR
jgi:hypothetical protein